MFDRRLKRIAFVLQSFGFPLKFGLLIQSGHTRLCIVGKKKSWTKGKVKELRYLFFHFLSIHEFLKILNFGRYNGSCVFKNSPWITLLSYLILIKLNHHGLHLCLRTVVSTKCGACNWIFSVKFPSTHALSSTDVSVRQNNIKVVAQDETASFLRSVFRKSERKCQIENFLQVIQIGKFSIDNLFEETIFKGKFEHEPQRPLYPLDRKINLFMLSCSFARKIWWAPTKR